MKKILTFVLMGIIACATINVSAQSTSKELKKELRKRATREVRKEAKNLKKIGYHVIPGDLPMERQLERFWMKQYEKDDNEQLLYISSRQSAVAETQAAAQLQATELAKLDIAAQIGSNIGALVDNNIANQQINTEDAASITKTVASSKNLISEELGRVLPMTILMREVGDHKVEIQTSVVYDQKTAMEKAKRVLRAELEKQTDLNQEKLEKLMNFNN
ncbi:MAG: hypothetical protein EOL95_10045 [Bacteroidia bacterium]|nr:hypothetical protein [Bacteroidia bacterium]